MVTLPPPPLSLLKRAFSPVTEVASTQFLWKIVFKDATFYVVSRVATEAIVKAENILTARWKDVDRMPDTHIVKCVCVYGIDFVE